MGGPGRFRRIAGGAAKIVAALVAIVALGLVAGAIFLRTRPGHELVRRTLQAQLRRVLPGLDIGRVEGGVLRDLVLGDVRVRDDRGRPAVGVDLIEARYRLLPLLRREVAVADLRIRGVRFDGQPDPRGGLNLAHLTAPSAPRADGEKQTWIIAIEHVRVEDVSGRLTTSDGDTSTLADLRLEGGARVEGSRDVSAWVRAFSARARVGQRALAVELPEARVELRPRTVVARVASLAVTGLLPTDDVVTIDADARGPRERATAHVRVRAGAARARADGTVDLGAGGLGAWEGTLKVSDLDPARFVAGAPAARVGLELRASGAGERWNVPSATMRADGATLTASGHGRGAAGVVEAKAHLDGAALPGGARGHAVVSLQAERTAMGTFTARAHGDVDGLVAGDVRVGRARLELDAHGTPAMPAGTLDLTGADIVAKGAPKIERLTARLSLQPGAADGLRLHAAAWGPRLHLAVDARGTGTARQGDVTLERLALDVTSRTFRQQLALTKPARVSYRTRAGALQVAVAPTVLRGEGARFTGLAAFEGEYSPSATGRAPLARLELRLHQASTGGMAPVDAEVKATLTRARGEVHASAVMPSSGARLRLDADVPLSVPRHGPPRLAARGRTQLTLTARELTVQTIPPLRRLLARQGLVGGTLSVDVSATGDAAHPEAQGTLDARDVVYRDIAGLRRDARIRVVPGLGAKVQVNAREGALAAEATLRMRGATVVDARARLGVDLGRLLRGAALADVPLHVTAQLPGLRLATLGELANELRGLDGQLHGRLDVEGTVRRPTGHAELAVDGASIDDVRFRQVRLSADADGRALRARLTLEQLGGGRLDGSLALERGTGHMDAALSGKNLDVGFLRPFLPRVRELGGTAQLSLTATGTLETPRIAGELSLDRGRLGLVGQPTFKDVHLTAAGHEGRLDLRDLSLKSGDGDLKGSGWVVLGGPRQTTPRSVELRLHAHRFLVAIAGRSSARIDGELVLAAALRDDVLSGTVNVPKANVWLPKLPTGGDKLQRVAPHADVRFVDEAALAAAAREAEQQHDAAAAAIRLALHAKAGLVRVRGQDVDLDVKSDLQIGTVPDGPHRGALMLEGTIQVPRGHLDVLGRRFDVHHGLVSFDGEADNDPALDIRLTRQFPEALVAIELRGTARKPDLRLTSEPGIYDRAQIASLILTGSGGGRSADSGSFDATSAVTTAVMGRIADQLAPELGLDVVRIETRDVVNQAAPTQTLTPQGVAPQGQGPSTRNTRVEVGKYVTERVYVSYAYVFGASVTSNRNEARIEYRMTRRWVLETLFGDAGQGGLDAMWTYRF